jgi:predicted nucleic acid-binding protein
MRYLFDTSALLAHYRSERGGEAVHRLLQNDAIEPVIASITIAEFTRRLRDLGADEKTIAEVMESYLAMMEEVVPVDAPVAWESDRLQRVSPQRLPLADALIAACAKSREATLVHRDVHLRHLPEGLLSQLDLDRP